MVKHVTAIFVWSINMSSILNFTYSRRVFLKRLSLVGIIIVFYILSLSKFTDVPGAIFFILFGWMIPTLINLIISNYIACDLFFIKYFSLRILKFILVSFLLGVNYKLPYVLGIIPYQPYDFKMNVVHPLESNASFEQSGSSLYSLRSSLFSFLSISVNTNNGMNFTIESPKPMLLFPKGKKDLTSRTKDYKVEVLALNGKNHVQYEITIKEEGAIQIQMEAKYPNVALAVGLKTEKIPPLNSLLFWEYSGELLLTNNIWQVLLDRPFRIKTFNDLINESK